MIKTATGAQRYNNRMQNIFDNAKVLKEKYPTIHCNRCDELFTGTKEIFGTRKQEVITINHRCI